MEITIRSVADALVAELKNAIDAIAASPVAVGTGDVPRGSGWAAAIAVGGEMTGAIEAWMDGPGAAALTKAVLGSDPPADAEVIDMLRELWTQSASAVTLKTGFAGLTFSVSAPSPAPAPPSVPAAFSVTGDALACAIAISGHVAAPVQAATVPSGMPEGIPNSKLDVVLDIDLPLTVRFGRTVMTLKALAGLGPGSIVDMGRSPDEPVEMLVGDRIIARGEVVIVGGNYGVRITDLVSHAERVRALEA